MNYRCEICNISFTTKQRLNSHIESEKHKIIFKLYTNWKTQHDIELNVLHDKINTLNEELNKKHELFLDNIKLKEKIKYLEEKTEEYRKIVEKSATKTTVKNNYNHNNYLNYISAEPIKFNEIKSQLKQIVNCETVMYDEDDFHDHIVDNILKDKNGKDKVLCTDINRKNFTYKDENTGQLISDPELDNLRTKLRNGIKLKQVRNELLEKLKKDYENNGNVGKDPYLKFYEMIQKLNFGVPFVDHVAKKTYVKSKNSDVVKVNNSKIHTNENVATDVCSGNQIENVTITELTDKNTLESTDISHKSRTINRNGKEYVSISHISDEKIRELFTEEEYLEYLELVKEFGKELICD